MLRHVLFLLFVSVTLQAENVDPTRFQAMEWRNIGPFRGGRSNASTGVPLQPGVFYLGVSAAAFGKRPIAALRGRTSPTVS